VGGDPDGIFEKDKSCLFCVHSCACPSVGRWEADKEEETTTQTTTRGQASKNTFATKCKREIPFFAMKCIEIPLVITAIGLGGLGGIIPPSRGGWGAKPLQY
jgi:hypothetical protein